MLDGATEMFEAQRPVVGQLAHDDMAKSFTRDYTLAKLRLAIMNPEGFAAWLAGQRWWRTAGIAHTSRTCPIARYLEKECDFEIVGIGYGYIQVCARNVTYGGEGVAAVVALRTPPWVRRFMGEVDERPTYGTAKIRSKVSVLRARAALAAVRKMAA